MNDVGGSRSYFLDAVDHKFLLLLHGSICPRKNSLADRLVGISADMLLALHILLDILSCLNSLVLFI